MVRRNVVLGSGRIDKNYKKNSEILGRDIVGARVCG